MRIQLLKHPLPLALLSAALLFSCSRDEAPGGAPPVPGKIGFSTLDRRLSTKVAPMVSDGMRSFRVWAYETGTGVLTNLDGEEVTRADKDADWTYSPLQEWPAAGETVDFYAVSPKDAVTSLTITSLPGDTTFSYTVPVAADQVDLLVVKKDYVAAGEVTAPVTLTFGHVLSRIGLKVNTDALGSNKTYKIQDVKLLNVKSVGTYSLTNGTWSNPTQPETYDIPVDAAWSNPGKQLTQTETEVVGVDNGLMVLPQTVSGGFYEVKDTPSDPATGNYLALTATMVKGPSNDKRIPSTSRL